jgi:three-Cys-motif partner protein
LADEIDPSDGLPLAEVGAWANEKHELLRRYVDATRGVRKKWTDPKAAKAGTSPQGATFIDLFCGPGRARIRETGTLIDGSAIAAATMAAKGGAPFSAIFVGDAAPGFADATQKRLAACDIAATALSGEAEHTARNIVRQLNKHALHFVFLDPFKLDPLPFTVLEQFAKLKHVDILINFATADLQRNLRLYQGQPEGPLDRVAPGWRDKVNANERGDKVRAAFLAHWYGLIRNRLRLEVYDDVLIKGPGGQRLYWLVMVSGDDKAGDIWAKINSRQGKLL